MTRRLVHHLATITRRDRSEMARELAKAVALKNVNRVDRAQAHGNKLVQALLRLRLIRSE